MPNSMIAGCDEVGRGCLAGSVVASVVILPETYHLPLLRDSKQLTKKQRATLAPLITSQAIAWAIGEASAEEIDQINILQATFLAMHRAIDQLVIVHKPTLLLIDGNSFKPYPGIAHECIVRGDQTVPAIAAASILAKTYRDELMQRLAQTYGGYGWETNVGYPTLHHCRAIKVKGYTPYHRRSYRVTNYE